MSNCIFCANGNDLSENDQCAACGRTGPAIHDHGLWLRDVSNEKVRAALRQANGGTQPVAWRVNYHDDNWMLCHTREAAEHESNGKCRVEPLYAAPPEHIPTPAQPVAWTNAEQLGFLKDPAYALIPMAMWAKRDEKYADVALYAAPPPAAPGAGCKACDGSGEIFMGVGGADDPERCHVCDGTGEQPPAAPVETERADAMNAGLNEAAFRKAWQAFQNTPIDLVEDSDDQTCKCLSNAIKSFLSAERRYTEKEVSDTVEKVIAGMLERGEIADTRAHPRLSAETGDAPEGATHMRRPEYITAWLFDRKSTMPIWLIEKYKSIPLPDDKIGHYATAIEGEFYRWYDPAKFNEMFSAISGQPQGAGK